MYYQTIHERPLVEGAVSRTPPYAYDFISGNELLSLLPQYSLPDYEGPFAFPFPDVSRQLETLAEAGIRYIVFHRDRTPPAMLAAWQSFVVVDPVYEDASLVVYHTRPDYKIAVRLTEELGLAKTDNLVPSAIPQASWLQFDLHWVALESPSREYDYRVTLRDATGETIATYDVELEWPGGALFTSHFTGQIDPFLPAGHYQVSVEIINPDTAQTVGMPADLGALEVQALPRQYTHPRVSTAANAVFDDQICLIGYDVEQTETFLNLTLYWQAVRRMDRDYKVFVHLSSDDTVVAQYDGMPRDWTYLTSWWDKDEIVTDPITLDVSRLSPGQYEVAVGVYDPATLERLPVVDQAGTSLPERKLVLPFTIEIQ
ncbi:MAG: hypothetical protein DRI77_14650 [Chloroflexi bacterium]|nr:MAG: hypothetical protein DRI77_14650 [Chloroflexota bacterium]